MSVNENQRFIDTDGEQTPVTKVVYKAYKRPLWAEHKHKERPSVSDDTIFI